MSVSAGCYQPNISDQQKEGVIGSFNNAQTLSGNFHSNETFKSLLGHYGGLLAEQQKSLFIGYQCVHATTSVDEVTPTYKAEPDYYPLLGLPGCLSKDKAIFVRLSKEDQIKLSGKFQNGVIGGFRCIRSAALMKEGLLPVYAFDPHGLRSIPIASVPYSEHQTFSKGDGHVI